MDRAYIDFSWLWSIDQASAFFVSRLKKSINWNRIVSHKLDKSIGLRCDQEILLTSNRLKQLYPKRVRRVSFRDEEKGTRVSNEQLHPVGRNNSRALQGALGNRIVFQMDKAKS